MIKERVQENLFLQSDYCIEGFKETQLLNDLNELSQNTKCEVIIPEDIILYSVESICKEGINIMKIETENMNVRDLFPLKDSTSVFMKGTGNYFLFSYAEMYLNGLSESLIEEIKEVGYFMGYNNTYFIPSKGFMATFCRQLGITKLPSIPDPIREIFISHLLRDAEQFAMVYRYKEGVGKALACFSPKYIYIEQNKALNDILYGLKQINISVQVNKYKISQIKTMVYITFNDKIRIIKVGDKKKKICPTVVLSMSDTGECSYILQNYISINGRGFYIGEPVKMQHRCIMESSNLIADYKEYQYSNIDIVLSKLDSIKDTSINYKPQYIKLLKSIKFEAALGSVLYEELIQNIPEKKCSSIELFMDMLDIIGKLNKIAFEKHGKMLPESTIFRCEKQLGQLFDSKVAKGVFGW